MKFIVQGDLPHHDIQTMAQVFFHRIGFDLISEPPKDGLCLHMQRKGRAIKAILYENNIAIDKFNAQIDFDDDSSVCRATKLAVYAILTAYTKHRPPWGLLTGIRPTKIAASLLAEGFSDKQIQHKLKTHHLVDHSRAALCTQIAQMQKYILDDSVSPKDAVSIYISIPFCPSICHYCSFSGYPADKYTKHMYGYITALIKEIEYLGQLCRDKYIENIYIGGGTPTALDDVNFVRLLTTVSKHLMADKAFEYTIEAGRPDTITNEKLALMRRYGASRISINPQTLNDATLTKIGRQHTSAQFIRAYKMAQDSGFDNINIDLILGLPDETLDDVYRTLDGIVELNPKSCTIHTLSVKRASKMHQDKEIHSISQMSDMLLASRAYMDSLSLEPYYMYRQKNSLGNYENVGYASLGYACHYNIQIMEEKQTIYAAGAGAITKLVDIESGRIERVFNLRNPVEYIEKVDEMIERKKRQV
ncbi:MAG: coproporphyrinogen dehydrogenase HemZ [Defluviitaleaceae bacterium]|nr:coproporphyrinogen dehydrogenase HemZ [Defluviitaleaceae bacterium]